MWRPNHASGTWPQRERAMKQWLISCFPAAGRGGSCQPRRQAAQVAVVSLPADRAALGHHLQSKIPQDQAGDISRSAKIFGTPVGNGRIGVLPN
jgi:hypothetical protein